MSAMRSVDVDRLDQQHAHRKTVLITFESPKKEIKQQTDTINPTLTYIHKRVQIYRNRARL